MEKSSVKIPVREIDSWPVGLTQVPYWAFQREDVYDKEQEQLFQGESLELLVS